MINLRIETLLVRAFRGVEDLTIGFSELATIVGENATGKSTIGLTINRALLQEETNQKQITPEDYPYGVPGATEIRPTLNLSTEELESLVFRALLPDAGSERYPVIRTWLEGQGNQLEIIVRPSKTEAKWGGLLFTGNQVAGEQPSEGNKGPWANFIGQGSDREVSSPAAVQMAVANRVYEIRETVPRLVAALIRDRFKYFDEVRTPSVGIGRSGAVESMGARNCQRAAELERSHR